MQKILSILFWLMPFMCKAQVKDSVLLAKESKVINANGPSIKSDKTDTYKPEIFTSGFIDIINNGQVNASARFIRLYIGEPGKFAIPLSLYGGVSNNSFQNQNTGGQLLKSNDHLINQYINPLSGLINISIDGITYFKKTQKITKTGLLYHFGERVLTGIKVGQITNTQTGKPVNFVNSFGTAGLYFQTGAWERNNAKNVGIFWLVARYHFTYSNSKQIKEFLPDAKTNGVYTGYSIGFGVEINNLVNLKAIYYKYIKVPEIDYGLPIYQFSFNYALNKN
jgi:hypothetical protein